MTLLVAMACALCLFLAGLTARLGTAAVARTRAQLAADAAALGAVAESAPYGGGAHRLQATRLAHSNGARLLACSCGPGATAVQVRVAVDGVVAEARAVLDVEMLRPARAAARTGALHPSLAHAVARLVRGSSGRIWVVSGYRSTTHQRELWRDAVARHGSAEAADDWVARPGTSMHERGLAVDLGGDLNLAVSLIDQLQLPLHRPLPREPWHFELEGSRHGGALGAG